MRLSLPITRSAVSKRTMKESIRDEVLSLIASGILRVGDELPSERDLAKDLEVSRETVRGAIQLLCEQRVIETSHGARSRVTGVRPDLHRIGLTTITSISGYSLDDVFRTRIEVERIVMRESAERATDAFLERLERSLDAQLQTADDPVRYFICDRNFHLTIYNNCGNRLLADFAIDLYTYMLEERRGIVDRARALRGYRDHKAIVEAIHAGDASRAADLTEFHVQRQYKTSRSLRQGDAAAS